MKYIFYIYAIKEYFYFNSFHSISIMYSNIFQIICVKNYQFNTLLWFRRLVQLNFLHCYYIIYSSTILRLIHCDPSIFLLPIFPLLTCSRRTYYISCPSLSINKKNLVFYFGKINTHTDIEFNESSRNGVFVRKIWERYVTKQPLYSLEI